MHKSSKPRAGRAGLGVRKKVAQEDLQDEHDKRRLEQIAKNKLKMQELKLFDAVDDIQALISSTAAKRPKKMAQPRRSNMPAGEPRRSSRFDGKTAPDYTMKPEPAERVLREPKWTQSRNPIRRQDVDWPQRSLAARKAAFAAAHALADRIGGAKAAAKRLAPSIVSGGFWCNVPRKFAGKFPMRSKGETVLYSSEVPEDAAAMRYSTGVLAEGLEMMWPVTWLPRVERGTGLSGGWRGFSLDHELTPDDAMVMETLQGAGPHGLPALRIHIFRAQDYEEGAQE